MKKLFILCLITFMSSFLMACSLIGTVGGSEDVTLRLAAHSYWDAFWQAHWQHVGGVTECYGKRSSVVQINPIITDTAYMRRVLNHEHVHQAQVRKLTCEGLNKIYSKPEGVVRLETPAMKAMGSNMESVYQTMRDYYIAPDSMKDGMSDDSLKKLVRKYY